MFSLLTFFLGECAGLRKRAAAKGVGTEAKAASSPL